PTVAERSQQKHARPGKEFDTQSWNGGVQMKKLFLGSVALVALGLGAPAFAADRPVPYTPPPPPAPVYTWTGCYVGANAGNSRGRSEHTTTGTSLLPTQPGGIPTLAPFRLDPALRATSTCPASSAASRAAATIRSARGSSASKSTAPRPTRKARISR